MTKPELFKMISAQTRFDKSEIKTIIESFYAVVQDNFINRNIIILRRFGTFKVDKREEKKARDIGRNKIIVVPEHFKPKFRPMKSFIEVVSRNII